MADIVAAYQVNNADFMTKVLEKFATEKAASDEAGITWSKQKSFILYIN